jgi:hypothetical protein
MAKRKQTPEEKYGYLNWDIVDVKKDTVGEIYRFEEVNNKGRIYYSFSYAIIPKMGLRLYRGDIGQLVLDYNWELTNIYNFAEMVRRANPYLKQGNRDFKEDFDLMYYAISTAEKKIKEYRAKNTIIHALGDDSGNK